MRGWTTSTSTTKRARRTFAQTSSPHDKSQTSRNSVSTIKASGEQLPFVRGTIVSLLRPPKPNSLPLTKETRLPNLLASRCPSSLHQQTSSKRRNYRCLSFYNPSRNRDPKNSPSQPWILDPRGLLVVGRVWPICRPSTRLPRVVHNSIARSAVPRHKLDNPTFRRWIRAGDGLIWIDVRN